MYRGEGGFDLDTLAVGLRGKVAEHQIAKFAVGYTAALPDVAECVDDWVRNRTPHLPAPADGRAAGGHIQQGQGAYARIKGPNSLDR